MSKKHKNLVKGHQPRPIIADYLKEVTKLAPKFERLKMEGIPLNEDQDYHNLKQKKIRVMQLLFECMDTVNQFLATVSKEKKLQEMFDEDLKALLYDHGAFMGFVNSTLTWDYNNNNRNKEKKENIDNFRVILISLLQGIIARHAESIASIKLHEAVSKSIVKPDFYRVSAWTDFLASGVRIDDE